MSDASSIGRSGYLQNPRLAEAAFESVRKDGNFLDAADKALKSVLAVKAGEDNGKVKVTERELTTPPLTQPTPKAKEELNSAGKLALLLGQLMVLMGDVSLSQLEGRLATWKAMMESQKAMGEQLSQELQGALEGAEQATDAYQSALNTLKANQSILDAANKKLAQAQAKLDGLSPEDAGYTQALAARDQAASESMLAKQKVDQADQNAKSAHTLAVEKAQNADTLLTQAQGLGLKNETVQKSEKDNLSNVAKLTMLMAMFVELVGKNSEESLQNDLALFQALQEGRQAEMEKKSSEYQEEVRKSEELNRVMGCVGKILGALLTIVSVVAAAFTGGASLALAAVGLALMVADEMCQAFAGFSFIQEALKPLMENVLKPLMEKIGKAISKALESFGVDKKTADMVGSIVGAVLAAVVVVVAIAVLMLLGGKAAASNLGKALSKLIGNAIKKIVPDVLKTLAKKAGSVAGQIAREVGLPTDKVGKELMANRLKTFALGGEVLNAGTQAGGGIAAGVFMKNASDAMADFYLARTSMEQISRWLEQAVETFADSQKVTQELHKAMSTALQQNAEAGRFVLRQSRA
ncbi:type III secretion system translocon subunit SctE [Pluralibacter sp.]|uniref:type III secretion system translocon subunit SctE n=1 Tax=Pluralibacter sp. TaxID=1920032 RepID=UPI0025F0A95E|nr:type III secretion system translocon subunit SctE [Pluralibacter sp.]MBV8045296.1 type III secretion system translocon subunit SctE [Pluralibacter sp.]